MSTFDMVDNGPVLALNVGTLHNANRNLQARKYT